MKELTIEHQLGDVATIAEITFSIKELKEGRYFISEELDKDGNLFILNILHESYNQEQDERFVASEKFNGFFEVNPMKDILSTTNKIFPSDKEVVPFVLNDGADNIGLNLMAFDPHVVKRGRKKYDFLDISVNK